MKVLNLKDKSRENYNAAKLLRDNTLYRASCSRYYYAMFVKLNEICIRKLNYSHNDGANSHNNVINHYKRFMHDANYHDYGKLAKARTIASNMITAKDYRKDADYHEEDYIDDEICDELERFHQFLLDNWSDVNQIIENNKEVLS
ncbi:hypothetical protein [Mammaliicoccus sciuri]|uniref:hypothetical protein n=1 Tax=Mammaliicoccus sciuri TaxID=1296 RepID=UPI002DBE457C|nr:hypothetical protein [Mammaliicoccus sciuri]MEB8263393.1 hypothetical protein [Mammaliicoccus sciuri]